VVSGRHQNEHVPAPAASPRERLVAAVRPRYVKMDETVTTQVISVEGETG